MNDNVLDYHISQGGGVIAGPQGLGIVVGTDSKLVPSGWIFVDVNDPPPDTQEVLDALRAGRTNWPEAETVTSKKNRNQ